MNLNQIISISVVYIQKTVNSGQIVFEASRENMSQDRAEKSFADAEFQSKGGNWKG